MGSFATAAPVRSQARAGLAAALIVAFLGVFLVSAAGFVPLEALHNAAHDSRHGLAFPCH